MSNQREHSTFHGKVIIFSAPSGAGKTTIVHHLLKTIPELEFSVSACSRPPRTQEKQGKDYYFLSVKEFKDKILNNEFLEWEEVYPGQFYGTLKSELKRIWARKHHVLFDVDVVGGLNIKRQLKDRALAVFVQPPSLEELERRLRLRSTEDPESLRKRIEKAHRELSFANKFDKVLLNDDLDNALREAEEIVMNFIVS